MAKRLSEEAQRWQEAARERVELLLNSVYAGRQSHMARALGVPQSQLSRVVNGRLGVSPALLDALARLPYVNPPWVREGTGEPMLPRTEGTLPIALWVLPGWPERHPELLTGQSHPVAAAYERASRYWVAVPHGCPLLGRPDLALLAGDLLLLDADTSQWASLLPQCVGKLFGVRVPGEPAAYELGVLGRDDRGLFLDLIAMMLRLLEPRPPRPPVASTPTGPPIRRRINVDRPRPKTGEADQTKAASEAGQPAPTLTLADLVAVRICTMRL